MKLFLVLFVLRNQTEKWEREREREREWLKGKVPLCEEENSENDNGGEH